MSDTTVANVPETGSMSDRTVVKMPETDSPSPVQVPPEPEPEPDNGPQVQVPPPLSEHESFPWGSVLYYALAGALFLVLLASLAYLGAVMAFNGLGMGWLLLSASLAAIALVLVVEYTLWKRVFYYGLGAIAVAFYAFIVYLIGTTSMDILIPGRLRSDGSKEDPGRPQSPFESFDPTFWTGILLTFGIVLRFLRSCQKKRYLIACLWANFTACLAAALVLQYLAMPANQYDEVIRFLLLLALAILPIIDGRSRVQKA